MANSRSADRTREPSARRAAAPDGALGEAAHVGRRTHWQALQSTAGNRAVSRLLDVGDLAAPLTEAAADGLRSGAAPLEPDIRAEMEARFGCDLGSVRVHRDSTAARSAQSMHASAYTVGDDVVFGAGQYAPQASDGKRLLAHELAHVIQQRRGGAVPPPLPLESGGALEAAADHAASSVANGGGTVAVAGASAPGIAMQPSEGWYEWAMRQAREWRDWAFPPPAPALPPDWITRRYQPQPPLPPGAVPHAAGRWHEIPNDPNPVPQRTPQETATQLERRLPAPPGANPAVQPDRAGDPQDSPQRRATSQAQRAPQGGAPTPAIDPLDADTEVFTPRQQELRSLNSAQANPEVLETMEHRREWSRHRDWPSSFEHRREWMRRGRSLRRGSATVGGMLFTAVAVGSSIYFLSQSENPEDLLNRAADLAGEAVIGAALFKLMGPASAFLALESDNPEIARNRQTMEFIHANFGDYFESDAVTGKENYVGPGDFMTLFQEAYDLLFNTDAIVIPAPAATHGYPSKGSMAPVRLP